MSDTETPGPDDFSEGDLSDDSYELHTVRETISPLSVAEYGNDFGGKGVPETIGRTVLTSMFLTEQIGEDSVAKMAAAGAAVEVPAAISSLRGDMERLSGTRRSKKINELYASYPIPEGIFGATEGQQGVVEALSNASDEAVKSFVQWNKEYIDFMNDEHGEALRDELEATAAEVVDFLAQSGIPIDMERAQQKIARLKIRYIDPFSGIEQHRAGNYMSEDETIGIGPGSAAERRDTIIHEVLHALSGRLVIRESSLIGTQTLVEGGGYRMSNRHEWIDEAITEQLTNFIANGQRLDYESATAADFFPEDLEFVGVYRGYRSFLSRVTQEMEQEADLEILKPLLAGYFEDYEPENQPNSRFIHWKQAMQNLGDFLGPRQLARADQLFSRGWELLLEGYDEEGLEEDIEGLPNVAVIKPKSKDELAAVRTKRQQSKARQKAAAARTKYNRAA